VALLGIELLWELWLAPIRPGGSWLALKAVPLAFVLAALVRRTPHAHTVTALVLLPYFIEGVVRAASEHGRPAWIAGCAALLATIAFVSLYRLDRMQR